jgi:hypothetical protein
MKIYTLTEEYCFDGEVTFEVIESHKSEEQTIKAMKSQHESNMNLLPWSLLRDENELCIEETNNSIYVLNEADSEFYYLLKVEPTFLHD